MKIFVAGEQLGDEERVTAGNLKNLFINVAGGCAERRDTVGSERLQVNAVSAGRR